MIFRGQGEGSLPPVMLSIIPKMQPANKHRTRKTPTCRAFLLLRSYHWRFEGDRLHVCGSQELPETAGAFLSLVLATLCMRPDGYAIGTATRDRLP